MRKKLPSKIRLSISIDYNFKGELLDQYLGWLDDYEDTTAARKAFALDRFAPPNWRGTIDPKALLKVEVTK